VRFASAVPETAPAPPHEDYVSGTREVLIRSVERQMMGDVPVGVFLSGGLDSSLVAAIAARWCERHGTRLSTFAVGTPDSPDLAAARRVAEHLGTEHREFTYTAREALDSLGDVVRAIESFDPGLVRSAVPNFMLARGTAEHVKVVLTGEGADELFAGYAYMTEIESPAELHTELERTVGSLHNLNLQRCDRVTMAHGLEARVPFLDLEVIGWALSLPAAEKLTTPARPEKALLREAFAGWLPDDLLWRVKAEFGDGSGARDALSAVLEATVSEEDFARERHAVEPPLRTREEVAYFRVWRAHLAGVSAERTLSRFARA
jgi:asparagine synthase (glutamine-hydrolysing)